jgi:GWxTD domain-containing protein
MKLLEVLVSTPVSGALGWTVLHSLWQGTAIAIALAAVLACLRSARVRYAAACTSFFALLCAFALTLSRFLPESNTGTRALLPSALPAWREITLLSPRHALLPNLAALIPWLGPVWVCGVCLFYGRYAGGWLVSRRLRRRGVCRASERWQSLLAGLACELKLSRPVVLLESFFAEAPLVIGHFRPVLLVPLGFLAGLPPDQVEAILLHELAHIRRADYMVNVIQRVGEGLLFYHPAAWWIAHVIRTERENCCDDIVMAHRRGNAHAYAAALMELEKNRFDKRPLRNAAAVAADGGNLMKRIRRLLYPAGPTGLWAPAVAALVLTLGSGGLYAAWRAVPATPAQSVGTAQSPWAKWLNEDVVYIISDEEKAAFERLTADGERQQFIEQFWEKRDPTPGTPENEFNDEHYRRIAFADKHFRTAAGTPGWQTDRGHIYIVYGPPDEIDSHPKKAGTYGVETWLYKKVQGIEGEQTFAFFDRTGGGDFRLGPANSVANSGSK